MAQIYRFSALQFAVFLVAAATSGHADEYVTHDPAPPWPVYSSGPVYAPLQVPHVSVPSSYFSANNYFQSRPANYVFVGSCSSCQPFVAHSRLVTSTSPLTFAGYAFTSSHLTNPILQSTPLMQVGPGHEAASFVAIGMNSPVTGEVSQNFTLQVPPWLPNSSTHEPIQSDLPATLIENSPVVDQVTTPPETATIQTPQQALDPVIPRLPTNDVPAEVVAEQVGKPIAIAETDDETLPAPAPTLDVVAEPVMPDTAKAEAATQSNAETPENKVADSGVTVAAADAKLQTDSQPTAEMKRPEARTEEPAPETSDDKVAATSAKPSSSTTEDSGKAMKANQDTESSRNTSVPESTPANKLESKGDSRNKRKRETSAPKKEIKRAPAVLPLLAWNMAALNLPKGTEAVSSSEIVSQNSIRIDENSGLDLRKGWVSFPSSSKELFEGIVKAKKFSIVATVTCDNDTQNGPARIITNSQDSAERNFMLGQDESKFVVRIRTSHDDANGSQHETSFGQVKPGKRQNIAVIYDGRKLTCFVDGKEAEQRKFSADFASWKRFPISAGNEANGDREWVGRIHSLLVLPTADADQVTKLLDDSDS